MKRSYALYLIAGLLALHACIRDEVLPAPVINTVSSDPTISGEILTISGNYFDAATISVLADGSEVILPSSPTLTELNIIAPTVNETRDVVLIVKTRYGASPPFVVTVRPPRPVIRKVIQAKAGTGKLIKIVAGNLRQLKKVEFSQSTEKIIEAAFMIVSDTVMTTVPAGLDPGVCDLRLETLSGYSEPFAFTVLAAPKVVQLIPPNGVAGTLVRVSGENLREVNTAFVGAVSAEIISVSSNYIDVRIPALAVTDTIKLDGPAGRTKSPTPFVVLAKPEITSISKMSGAENDDITINGKGLDGLFLISFAGTPSTISSNTSTRVVTKVPVGAQSGKIHLTNKAGTAESKDPFIVAGKPAISGFEPASGVANTTVTIKGANLGTITSVKIGDKVQTIVAGTLTDQQFQVKVASGTVTGKISVSGPTGSFETTQLFTVTGSPQITSLEPTSGTPGTVVLVKGINFPANPTVTFTSGAAAVVSKATSTEITCQVPAAAITGTITVNGAVSPASFTVAIKPTLQSFTPVRGAAGADVTINGKYLTGSTVRFTNNLVATTSSITDTRIVVKVPSGAVTGTISVTNATGTTATETNFEVVGAPTVTSVSPSSGSVGSSITLTGTNLHNTPSVKFSNNITATIESFKANQILVKVPAAASSGPITVTTEGGTVQTSAFTVIEKPKINGISPAQGAQGEMITITGSSFINPLTLVFDGTEYPATATGNTIKLRVPVGSTFNKNVGVAVKTSSDISNSYAFGLLAAPTAGSLKLKPNNNPVNWPVLLEGTNLGPVSRVTVDGTPVTLDYKASNAITFKVPSIATGGVDKAVKVRLFYTSDFETSYSMEMNFTVLAAPPPGAFPPPIIYLPPPPPVNLTPNIDANWPIPFNEENTDDYWGGLFDLRLDTDQDGQQSGSIYGDVNGTFNGGYLSVLINGERYEGQFIGAGSCILLTNVNTGRQLALGSCDCQTATCN